MLGMVLKWLTGGGISAIGKQINRAIEIRETAKTDQAKLDADIVLKQLQARQEVLLSEQGKWLTAWIRPAIAAAFVIYIWKIVVWDKVLGLGTTDGLSDNMTWVMTTVVGAYFLTRPFEKIFKRK